MSYEAGIEAAEDLLRKHNKPFWLGKAVVEAFLGEVGTVYVESGAEMTNSLQEAIWEEYSKRMLVPLRPKEGA